jgi:hypothetical protein
MITRCSFAVGTCTTFSVQAVAPGSPSHWKRTLFTRTKEARDLPVPP